VGRLSETKNHYVSHTLENFLVRVSFTRQATDQTMQGALIVEDSNESNSEYESSTSEDESSESEDESSESGESPDHGCDRSDNQHLPMELVPLWDACADGDEYAVRELLRVGEVELEYGYGGTTPLLVAVTYGCEGLCYLKEGDSIFKIGDPFWQIDNPLFQAALHTATETRQHHRNIVSMLLRAGADANFVSEEGTTCLTAAGDVCMVQILMENSPYLREFADKTAALRIAVDCNQVDLALLLLQYGADIKSVDWGVHPETLTAFDSEMLRRAKCEAFAMGHHPRLGAGSRVSSLNPDVLRMVLGRV